MERRVRVGSGCLRPLGLLVIVGSLALWTAGASAAAQAPAPSRLRPEASPQLDLLSPPGARPSIRGIVYRSASGRPQPGVLVLHGSAGLRPDYHAYAFELSRHGYAVLLVDLFADTGPAEAGSDQRLASWPVWQGTVRNALDCLRRQPGVDGSRLGVVGFSRGAWLAFTTLGNAPDVRALVAYYGVGTQALDWQPRGPAVLLLFGGRDPYAGPAIVAKVAGGLRAAGRAVELQVYGDVGHSFNFLSGDDERVRRATSDALAVALAFLARHLTQER